MMLRRISTALKSPVCALCARPQPQLRLLSTFIPSRPTTATQLPPFLFRRHLAVIAQPPTLDPSNDDYDIDPALATAVLHLTEPAMAQIAKAQKKANDYDLALRVSVESGGCHGYQYKMEVTTKRQEDDYLFNPSAFDPNIKVLIDSSSLPLIHGSTIDYATELIGSSFRIKGNPHASDKGGCGCGVSWELKE
ncbi:hypothetical protein P7C70_g5520, partial [Phenoliferia sp. Uapishka_3]